MFTFKCNSADIQRQKTRYPGLYDALYEVIERVDPIGLAFEPGEYWPEVNDIMVNLNECQSAKDCREMVIQVFDYWFGNSNALHRDPEFHLDIWAIRQRFKVRPY